ncbi:MAG: LamG domain-containing protein, partial [Candidatus Colwellbacteria bacterium]|nr:LamG domain-containing protein [Candidatus Colwellbacteria bacterium]
LVGYWPMDEGTGSIVNSSFGGMTGAVTGTTWVAGKNGNALNFAANAIDSVSLPNTLLNGMGDFTISAWIYLNGVSGTRSLIGGANVSQDNEFMMRATGSKLSAYMKGAGDYLGATTVSSGRWYHFIFTRSGGQAKIYLDGRQDFSGAISALPMIVDSGGLVLGQEQDSVGGNFDSGQAWNGRIDEVRFFSRSISAGEALALYNGEK